LKTKNKEIVNLALDNYKDTKNINIILYYTSSIIINNYDIMLKAIRINGLAIKYISDELKNNEIIAFEAIKNNIDSFNFISDNLKNNKDFLINVYNLNSNIIHIDQINTFILDFHNCNNSFISIDFITNNYQYLHKFSNYKFITNYLYQNNHYNLLSLNKFILQFIASNIIFFEKFMDYLIETNNYDIIYSYEEFNEYLKEHYKSIVLSIDDINNSYNTDNLKKEMQFNFNDIKIIWI